MTVIVHHLENSRQESAIMPVHSVRPPSHSPDMRQCSMLAGASASCGFWRSCRSPMRSSIMREIPRYSSLTQHMEG